MMLPISQGQGESVSSTGSLSSWPGSQINFHIEFNICMPFKLSATCPRPPPFTDTRVKLTVIKVFGYKQAHLLVTATQAGDRQLKGCPHLSPTDVQDANESKT